jgi:hypothetical protein
MKLFCSTPYQFSYYIEPSKMVTDAAFSVYTGSLSGSNAAQDTG